MTIEPASPAAPRAPTIADADRSLAALLVLAERDVDAAVLSLARGRVRHLLQVGPRPPEPSSDRGRDLAAFVDQFVIDVSGIDDAMRAVTFGHLGADALAVAQGLYLVDLSTRRAIAVERLGLGDTASVDAPTARQAPPEDHEQLWPALEAHWRLVARLDHLDPLTTELVRLRGAAAHHCRLCRSRRNSDALEAVAGSSAEIDPLAAVLAPVPAGLEPRQAALIKLVDVLVGQPTDIDRPLVAELRRHATEQELAEVLHDVVRNAANKIAVAFGADAAQVTSGVELFTVDDAGDVQVVGVPGS